MVQKTGKFLTKPKIKGIMVRVKKYPSGAKEEDIESGKVNPYEDTCKEVVMINADD